MKMKCQFQRPRGLRRRSAGARLLRLRVRIPPVRGCLSVVNVVCCQVEDSASGWPLVQRSPTERGCFWVWSWSLDNEKALPNQWLNAPCKIKEVKLLGGLIKHQNTDAFLCITLSIIYNILYIYMYIYYIYFIRILSRGYPDWGFSVLFPRL